MKTLRETVEIYKGRKAPEVFDEPRPDTKSYLQIEDLRPDATPKFARDPEGTIANKDDVIIAWDGANAGTVSFGLEGYIGSTLAILRPTEKDVFTPFLGYYLRSKFNYIRENTTGATIPHVSRDALESLTLEFPPLPEQRRIAALLDKADYLRRTRRYAAQLSDTFLASIFITAFYKNASKEWDLVNIESLVKKGANSIRTGPFGSQLKHSEFHSEGKAAVLMIDNIVENRFVWGEPRFITEKKYQELRRYTVFPDDLVITIMATTGRCAVIPENIPLAINTKHLCCITLDQSQVLPVFLKHCFLYHPQVLKQMGVSERGAIMPGLNMEIIKNLILRLPPLPLQQKFARTVRQFEHLRALQREADRQAEHLFQTLLHRAFSSQG